MTTASTETSALQQRVDAFSSDVIGRINQAIIDHNMTYEEYDAAKQWLIRVGQAGEWPLFLDVWVEHTVEQLAAHSRHGSQGTILGPFSLPDGAEAPVQGAPADAPGRARRPAGAPRPGPQPGRPAGRRRDPRHVAGRRRRLLIPASPPHRRRRTA